MQIASCFNPSWIFFPKRALAWVCLLMGLFPLVLLFGCAAGSPSFSAQQGIHLQGSVHGGHQPISGSLIQLYAVGTTGNGSAATPLISKDVRTDSSGNFDITGLYTCPSSDSIVYLVAQGGNPGLAAGTNNSSIALLAALGPCGALASSTSISINEVTTVASLWPLAPYAKTSARIGFASESDYQAVGDYIDSLANISAGTAPGPMLTPPDIAPTTKLYTLAGIFSACVNSSGGDAGDGTPCGRLFSDATIGSNAPPSDTVAAAIAIAQHPSQNVADIYYLLPPSSTFQPTLASSPSDWTLPIISTPAAPLLSPASGSYASGQQANIEESTPGASIYYTTDGSVPTGSSLLYSGPFPLTRSQTVNAVAIIDGLSSAGASNTYTINAQVSVSLMPASVTLAPSQTQMFIASVANSSNTAVTWSLNPAVGSISNRGVYTAPAAIATAQTVTVTATSAADSTKAAIAAIALTPAVSVSLTPTTATLGPSQTEAFLASVANSSNTSVTWSLSPAVGSISGSGVYTAPAAIATAQTVTVTATSAADSTKTASAAIALTPAVSVSLTPASVTLGPSQTQAFTASVANSSNTAVTWSLSPAVGSISNLGVYTAPATISVAQTVTVRATSSANPTKTASAAIALTPAITLTLPSSTISAGASLTGSVTLGQASANSVTIVLTSTDPTYVSIEPSTSTIPAGQTTTSFSYSGVAAGVSTLSASASGYSPASTQVTTALPTISASLFGLTVLNFENLTPSMSFGTTRSWDAYPDFDWSDANPSAGVYNFTYLDQFIAINQARGADIIYTLGRTPQWASSQPNAPSAYGPGQCAPPADMTNYDNYLRAIATHAAGRIKYWELWNEPQTATNYCGDMAAMVTMAQHASEIIKSIDPSALILSPAANGGPGPAWLSSFLTAGGGAYVDVIAFHGYWSATAEDVISVISNFKAAMAANGLAGKPMWDTESSWAGFGNLPTPTGSQQVGFIAKDYLLHWSQGVSRFVWYAYDGGSTWGGLWASKTGESAAAISYKEVYKWMVGAALTTPCLESVSHVWTCTLSRPGGYTAQAVWISNSTASFTVPAQYTLYRDLTGTVYSITNHTITVGDQPILLETVDIPS